MLIVLIASPANRQTLSPTRVTTITVSLQNRMHTLRLMGEAVELVLLIAVFVVVVAAAYFSLAKKGEDHGSTSQHQRRAQSPVAAIPTSIQVTLSSSDNTSHPEQAKPPILQNRDGSWTVNADTHFPLTIEGATREQLEMIRGLLSVPSWAARRSIVPIIARHNIRCRQIDEFVECYRPKYCAMLEQLKNNSQAWKTVSELDKQDLLLEFKRAAAASLPVVPRLHGDHNPTSYETAIALLESTESHPVVDATLIDRYGFDNLEFYLRLYVHSGGTPTAYQSDIDDFQRHAFEELVKAGLAVRGEEIPAEAILNNLRLKDMNDLVQDLIKKPFGRKANALDFLCRLPDLKERIKAKVPLRSLFCPVPLPEDFASASMAEVCAAMDYATTIGQLVGMTYQSARGCKELTDGSSTTRWTITTQDHPCKTCSELSQRSYGRHNPPRVPFHIGCRCWIWSE